MKAESISGPGRVARRTASALARLALIAVIGMFAAAAPAQTAAEKERQIVFGRDLYKSKATCQYCHRWDGMGDQGYGGNALSLRKTQMDREQLIEIVKCGRPSSAMPFHDRFAYTDKRCYDATRADLGTAVPPPPNGYLAAREIEAVVDYVLSAYVGKGDPTFAECQEFWGAEGSQQCASLKP